MSELFHEMLKSWFLFVEHWGYLGVFLLMALESSIVPIPSEIILPPAAFWAAQGKMDFWGVVAAGTAGSYFGSIVSYYISQWVGRPFVHRYGKYFFMSDEKITAAEVWLRDYGASGVFFARLLPVLRHLISIPAGLFRMPVKSFSIATIFGAFLWCWILSWLGREIIGSSPELLQSPEALIHVLKDKMRWLVAGIFGFAVLYGVMLYFRKPKHVK